MESGKYSLSVSTMLVIANMVGTGVFTSLGYQVGPVPSAFAIIILWGMGGVVALCGALSYAELATTLKRSGGEYLFLSKIFHPAVGFLSGWTSMMVGFAGAVSAVALAIGEYSHRLLGLPVQLVAVAAIVLVTIIHLFGVRTGGIAQNIFTGFKLSLILFFCISPLFMEVEGSGVSVMPSAGDWNIILSSGWAVSLVFVVYAYSGWNAASYIAGNMENPARNLPRALFTGTLVVMVIYLALNAMFMYVADFGELDGKNDIGNIVSEKLFGPSVALVFSGLFSVALLSTLSAMTIAGPRVGEAMGEDYPALRFFSRRNRFDMPWPAIVFQSAWSVMLVLVSSFKEIIQYISVSLSWFTLFSVIGLFFLRGKINASDRVFSVPFYPVTPLIFIVATVWMIGYVTWSDPSVILYSLATVGLGFILFLTIVPRQKS
ncbi:MAG: APC family permease [Bacteroidota bacterium]